METSYPKETPHPKPSSIRKNPPISHRGNPIPWFRRPDLNKVLPSRPLRVLASYQPDPPPSIPCIHHPQIHISHIHPLFTSLPNQLIEPPTEPPHLYLLHITCRLRIVPFLPPRTRSQVLAIPITTLSYPPMLFLLFLSRSQPAPTPAPCSVHMQVRRPSPATVHGLHPSVVRGRRNAVCTASSSTSGEARPLDTVGGGGRCYLPRPR